jgi:hypothetical protein
MNEGNELKRILADLEAQADPKGDVMLDAARLLREMALDISWLAPLAKLARAEWGDPEDDITAAEQQWSLD